MNLIKKGSGEKAILMLHGRGADAENILGIAELFDATCYAFTSEDNEWYPFHFMQSRVNNEPKLSRSLKLIHEVVSKLKETHEDVFVLGFSQGACLALEYGSLHEVSGVIAFSGGFIGTDDELPESVKTNKVLICCSDNDPFIPLSRAKNSASTYSNCGAKVITNFYQGYSHTITNEDLELARNFINYV